MRYQPCLMEAEGRGEPEGSSWAGWAPREVEIRVGRRRRTGRGLRSPGSHVLLLDPRESSVQAREGGWGGAGSLHAQGTWGGYTCSHDLAGQSVCSRFR